MTVKCPGISKKGLIKERAIISKREGVCGVLTTFVRLVNLEVCN